MDQGRQGLFKDESRRTTKGRTDNEAQVNHKRKARQGLQNKTGIARHDTK